METTEFIQPKANELGDITFTKYIERRLKEGWNPEKLQQAMRGMYSNFEPEIRDELDFYLQRYMENWLHPLMWRHDMYIVFISTAEDFRKNAPRPKDIVSDEQIL